MNSIIIDAPISEEKKRELLYRGQLLVYSPTPSSLALAEFARKMVEAAFHPLDPETAQFHLSVEKYAAILSELKPKFIHAPESKKCIQGMLGDLGFSLEKTYFDVPRMRSSTSDDFLTVRNRVCVSPASRHLVFRADVPDQLVAADVSDRFGKRDGVSSAILEPPGAQRIGGIQLRGMEPHKPAECRPIHQARYPETTQAGRADGT